VSNALWVPKIDGKGYHILFRKGHVLFVPKRSSFKLAVILGVREGNLYSLRGQPMRVVGNKSREKDEQEQVAPLVVR
jgi:hypothetical protein